MQNTLTPELQLLMLSGPAIAFTLALVFYWVWFHHGRTVYLLHLTAAFGAYAISALIQLTRTPHDVGLNTLASGVLYVLASMLLSKAMLQRIGQRFDHTLVLAIGVLIVAGLFYFYYIDQQLIYRIYILNFGCGLLLLTGLPRLFKLHNSKGIDRVLFWSYALFVASLFIRPPLTLVRYSSQFELSFNLSMFWLILQLSMTVLTVGLAVVLLLAIMSDKINTLRHERDADALTGLLNRRGFFNATQQLLSTGNVHPAYVIVCDLDKFKQINDTYGHATGDRILQRFGELAKSTLRASDIIGRIGGEEFAILLPVTKLSGARRLTERLRANLVAERFTGLPESFTLTASFGLTRLVPSENLLAAVARADQLLYDAKNTGRNKVVISPELLSPATAKQ